MSDLAKVYCFMCTKNKIRLGRNLECDRCLATKSIENLRQKIKKTSKILKAEDLAHINDANKYALHKTDTDTVPKN